MKLESSLICIFNSIQSVGLGGLRPNTIVLNWPDKWYKDSVERGDDEENLTLNGFVRKFFLYGFYY